MVSFLLTLRPRPQEAPPKETEVKVDGVDILEIANGICLFRGVCTERLKFDIEFSRKRGTTDNCYLIKVTFPMVFWTNIPCRATWLAAW